MGRLRENRELCPENVVSTVVKPTSSALVDTWGRIHRLSSTVRVGRTTGVNTLSIFHRSVSRQHAEISWDDVWYISDLKSANGTSVNGTPVSAAVALAHGDVVEFSGVAMYFCDNTKDMTRVGKNPMIPDTVDQIEVPEGLLAEQTGSYTVGELASEDGLQLIEPAGGGGALLLFKGQEIQLGEAQFTLLHVLNERRKREAHRPESVRGFIQSSELLELLHWDTPYPSDNHLKQLVRRTRRLLGGAGIEDVIESRRRFGYRLRDMD